MGLANWFRSLFSHPDEESAAREEYGLADRGEAEIQRDRASSEYAIADAADLAAHDEASFRRPPDPAP